MIDSVHVVIMRMIEEEPCVLLLDRRDPATFDGKTIHPAGTLDLPGGTTEPGESTLAALTRESLEETGIKLLTPGLTPFGIFLKLDENKVAYYHYSFRNGKDTEITLSNEHTAFGWYSLSALMRIGTTPGLRELVTLHADMAIYCLLNERKSKHRWLGLDGDLLMEQRNGVPEFRYLQPLSSH